MCEVSHGDLANAGHDRDEKGALAGGYISGKKEYGPVTICGACEQAAAVLCWNWICPNYGLAGKPWNCAKSIGS
jgi:hypothetical protein